jgi:hypothetical protein
MHMRSFERAMKAQSGVEESSPPPKATPRPIPKANENPESSSGVRPRSARKLLTIDNAITDIAIFSARAHTLRDVAEAAVEENVSLACADLAHVDLSGAQLARVNLTGAVLTEVDFSGADLSGATLASAKISKGKLVGAQLHGAILCGASLAGADLTEADLTEADLSGVDLRQACFSSTIMPDGRVWEVFRKDPLRGIKGTPEAHSRLCTAAFLSVFEANLL